jgi:predicted transcriptional regulator
MKKLTNVQKILKALESGPKTQAELVHQTKVKNVYQIISDLKKKKLVFMDTGKCVNLMKVPVAIDETTKVSAKQLGAATTQT